jgi:hypothetical protein
MQIPDSSTDDCDAICKLFENNKVFPLVEDQHRRKRLSDRVLNCKRILSFQSFFEDFRYIKPCFESLSILLPKGSWKEDKSFRQVFEHNWIRNTQHDNGKDDFLRCYIELWLFAMRDFPSLSSGKTSLPLQDKASTNKLIRPQLIIPNKEFEFAYNASLLGFKTCEIERFKCMHPSGIQQASPNRLPPEYSCDNDHDRLLPRDRSNRPSERYYLQDKDYLYPIYMIHANPARKKKYATRIAVTKDIVQCCWTDTERWNTLQRWSQKRRIPINVSRTIGNDVKPQQQRPFNTHDSAYSKRYQELIGKLEGDPVPTTMEFSRGFVKAQGMREESKALQKGKHEGTKPDHEPDNTDAVDPVTKALQLFETPDPGSGDANGASLGAQNNLDEKEMYGDVMDMDSPNASQEDDEDILTVDNRSLQVMPLSVAVRQGLDRKDDRSGDRTFLSPQPDDTTKSTSRASSVYSLHDIPDTDVAHQVGRKRECLVLHIDSSLVKRWSDDGASNFQASHQYPQKSQEDVDDLGERVLPQQAERIPQNAVRTSSQEEASAPHSKSVEDSDLAPATESSSGPIKAPSSPYYSIEEGSKAKRQIDAADELLNDTSSVEVSTYDGPADGQAPYRSSEQREDLPSSDDITKEQQGLLRFTRKRSAIRGDDELHELRGRRGATTPNADSHYSEDGSVKMDSSVKSESSAEPTEGLLKEVKSSSNQNQKRDTHLLFDEDGSTPLGFKVLGKRMRARNDKGSFKHKLQRILTDESL